MSANSHVGGEFTLSGCICVIQKAGKPYLCGQSGKMSDIH